LVVGAVYVETLSGARFFFAVELVVDNEASVKFIVERCESDNGVGKRALVRRALHMCVRPCGLTPAARRLARTCNNDPAPRPYAPMRCTGATTARSTARNRLSGSLSARAYAASSTSSSSTAATAATAATSRRTGDDDGLRSTNSNPSAATKSSTSTRGPRRIFPARLRNPAGCGATRDWRLKSLSSLDSCARKKKKEADERPKVVLQGQVRRGTRGGLVAPPVGTTDLLVSTVGRTLVCPRPPPRARARAAAAHGCPKTTKTLTRARRRVPLPPLRAVRNKAAAHCACSHGDFPFAQSARIATGERSPALLELHVGSPARAGARG